MKYTFLLILFLSTNCFAQEDELVIAEYSSNVITLNFLDSQFGLTKKKEIDVSKFDGWLSPSKYSSSYCIPTASSVLILTHFLLAFAFKKSNGQIHRI